MKIAIFHNFLDNIGGAEMVALILARELKADVYTTNIDQKKIYLMGYPDIKPISIGRIPVNAPFRQQAAMYRFRKLNLGKKYDHYIIGGDWAVSAAVNHKPNLWYVHSPIREIWDLYGYTRINTVPFLLRPGFDVWVSLNRSLNKKYVRQVDKLACNSRNTKKRIKKYLDRDSEVIHPPADAAKIYFKEYGDFWLSVNRLVSHKRIKIQLEAFRRMPEEKLVIVGSYEQSRHFRAYARECQRLKPKNVEILSWVSRERLLELYAGCRGLVASARDEDFGITPVEAMAAGKPVVAPREGGYKETLISGKTGILIDDIDAKKIIQAVKGIGKDPGRYKENCLSQAGKFAVSHFIKEIKQALP